MGKLSDASIQKFKNTIEQKTRKKVFEKIEQVGVEFISFGDNRCHYDGTITYRCKNSHINTQTIRHFMSGRGCWECRNIVISKSQLGSKGNNWQGGKTNFRRALKNHSTQWKKDSMKACNYKCIITGERFDDIHHLYPFNRILDEAIEILQLKKLETIGDYTDEDIKNIVDVLEEIERNYPLGVCLKKEVHQKFHKLYGNENFTPEDFYEFAKKGVSS